MVYEGGGTSSTEATTRPPGGGTGTPVATASLTGNVLPFDDSVNFSKKGWISHTLDIVV